MDIQLIERLQKINEEDLFPNASSEDIAGRKIEVEKRKAEEQKVARAKVEALFQEDDIPLNIIKELHEDNLAPNHSVNFSLEQWKEILIDIEAKEPGSLGRMADLAHDIEGTVMDLDNHTPVEMIDAARRNPKPKWYR